MDVPSAQAAAQEFAVVVALSAELQRGLRRKQNGPAVRLEGLQEARGEAQRSEVARQLRIPGWVLRSRTQHSGPKPVRRMNT